uniref:transglycosylase SLT domain-containing protein n=1 Tax=Pseudoalteromonas sp. TaxID=53249 RepID=UPI003D0B6CB1
RPSVIRAKEFYLLKDKLNARREWYYTTQTIPEEDLTKAAQLAHMWGWHDRAIYTLGQANYLDDMEIRFPLAHKAQVVSFSKKQNIDPSWSYAVIRQESAFASDAQSPKGAMGLMQIMPTTGRNIARTLQTKLKSSHQLLEVDTNIQFGISYLRKVLNRFDQNTVLATAAYNAGSQRVKSWLPEEESISPDIWIENIPFKETRNYLKQVLAYTAIYDMRLSAPIKPLKQRMPEIDTKQPAS